MSKPTKPHEYASDVLSLFRQGATKIAIAVAMHEALKVLRPLAQSHQGLVSVQSGRKIYGLRPISDLELQTPNSGIPFALKVEKQSSVEREKVAASLLQHCLTCTPSNADRSGPHIALLLGALSGYVPDAQSKRAKMPRPARKALVEQFQKSIQRIVRAHPASSWKKIATQLYGGGKIIAWDDNSVTYLNSNKRPRKITASHFRKLVSQGKSAQN